MSTSITFTPDLLAALAVFAFASSITPGPNNLMLMASGANFGLRRTAPHYLGVVLGFAFLVLCVGVGLGGLFVAYPLLRQILTLAGAAYLLYLAVSLARAKGVGGKDGAGGPMTFWQAVAFQWVNPKGWAMALTAVTTFLPKNNTVGDVLVGALVLGAVNAPCVGAWAGCGVALRRVLDRPRVLRAFNVTMALLLVASLYPLVLDLMAKVPR